MADDNKKGNNSEKNTGQKQPPVQAEQAKKEQPKSEVTKDVGQTAPEVLEKPSELNLEESSTPEEVAPPAPTPAPPVIQAPAPAPVISAPVTGMQLNEHDKTLLDSFTGRLQTYCDAMKPGKPINGRVEGANQQKALFKLIDQILNLPGPLFTVAWTNFLTTVKQNRQGAFSERHAFRFLEHTKLEAAVVLNYRNLIHLAIHTADPQSRRQMLKMIDIGMVCQNMTPNQRMADGANKLYGYYHDPM